MNALNTDLTDKMVYVKGIPAPVKVIGGSGAQSFTTGTLLVIEHNGQIERVSGLDVQRIDSE